MSIYVKINYINFLDSLTKNPNIINYSFLFYEMHLKYWIYFVFLIMKMIILVNLSNMPKQIIIHELSYVRSEIQVSVPKVCKSVNIIIISLKLKCNNNACSLSMWKQRKLLINLKKQEKGKHKMMVKYSREASPNVVAK